MTHAGISRGLKNSPLDCFLCAAAHRPVRFLARDTRKNTPAQAGVFFGDPCGNLPRAKKQSTGLFFCALQRTALFDFSHGIHEKTLQHKLECFLVTRAGIEPTLTA